MQLEHWSPITLDWAQKTSTKYFHLTLIVGALLSRWTLGVSSVLAAFAVDANGTSITESTLRSINIFLIELTTVWSSQISKRVRWRTPGCGSWRTKKWRVGLGIACFCSASYFCQLKGEVYLLILCSLVYISFDYVSVIDHSSSWIFIYYSNGARTIKLSSIINYFTPQNRHIVWHILGFSHEG